MVLGLLVLAGSLLAQTEVIGDLAGTWTLAGSSYLLVGNVQIPAGEALVIEPGVRVQALGWYNFDILGTLTAVGNPDQAIVFEATDAQVGWRGLHFASADSTSGLSYCTIRNNRAAYLGGGMFFYHSTATVQDCLISSNRSEFDGGGIDLYNSDAHFLRCEISDNSCADYGAGLALLRQLHHCGQ